MKFLVNADEESITMAIPFAQAFSAGVTVLESAETKGRGDTALGEFRSAGIHADLIRRESDWLRALRVATRAYHYDLVIVGKMWRRGVSGLIFGNVPRPLLADVRTNLLIVRRERPKIKRILITVGGGATGKQVLRWGGLCARAFDAQPVLLHVTGSVPGMFSGLAAAEENLSRFMLSNTAEARMFKLAAQSLRLISIEPELKLARGSTVEEILYEARTGNYDLVVVGSSFAAPTTMRLFMENVTEPLVSRLPCPVLIAREPQTRRNGQSRPVNEMK